MFNNSLRFFILFSILYNVFPLLSSYAHHGNTSEHEAHRILIINSRRNSLEWRGQLVEQFIRHIDRAKNQVSVMVDSLDTVMRNPDTDFPETVTLFSKRYHDYNPDIIIFIGDRAARFAVFSKNTFFREVAKFVVGVVDEKTTLRNEEAKIGGIRVVFPFEKMIEMITMHHPKVKCIVPITDSYSMHPLFSYILEGLRNGKINKYAYLMCPTYANWDLDELENKIKTEDPKDTVYLIIQADYDKTNRPVIMKNLSKLFIQYNIPAYSAFFSHFVGDEGLIGIYTFDINVLEDKLHKRIFDILETGQNIETFEIFDTVIPIIDVKIANQYNISSWSYPSNAKLLNNEDALLEKYFFIIKIGILIFIGAAICVIVGAIYTRRLLLDKSKEIEKIFSIFSELSFDGYLQYNSRTDVIEQVSSRLAHLVHDTPQEMKRKRLRYYTHPDDHEKLHESVEKLRNTSGHTENFRLRMRLEDNGYRHIEWRGFSEENIVYATAHDIDDLIKAQEELEKRNIDLINSNQNLEEFAYIISHDLQEPIRTIGTFTELLVSKIEITEDTKPIVNFISSGVSQMKHMIEDLLIYSRVNHQSRTNSLIVCDLVEKASSLVSFQFEKDGGKINIKRHTEPVSIWGDESFLLRAFINLLSNAGKFKKSDVPLEVNVVISTTPDEWVHIEFCDNGIGIDEKFHDRIFRIFSRLNKNIEGTGMGLAIVKRIVEKHNGRIYLVSEKGKGSCFTLSFPIYHPYRF